MQEALEQVDAHQPDVIITDLQMRTETEGLDLIKSAAQAEASPGFGDRPMVVLTAGDRKAVTEGLPAPVAEKLDSIWMDLQTGLAGLSTKGRQVIVDGATHDMPFEKPDVIVDAIREVLDAGGA